jgi:hypothetical protein
MDQADMFVDGGSNKQLVKMLMDQTDMFVDGGSNKQ